MNGELPPEVWAERDVAATLSPHDLSGETRAVELVVQPLAIRGRENGAGGSSRQSLIAVYRKAQKAHDSEDCERWEADDVAQTLDAGGHAARTATAVVTITGDRSHALTSEGADASEDGTGRGTPIIAATLTSGGHPNSSAPGRRQEDDVNLVTFQPDAGGDTTMSIGDTAPCLSVGQKAAIKSETTVRRLTPVECERLQGFPDDWTATSNGVPQADSPRYKQMGNAVAVPVFEWVARRIVASEEAL